MSHEQSDTHGQPDNRDHHEHPPEHHHFEIRIDRQEFKVTLRHMTGQQLRNLPTPTIGPNLDLFEVVPGGSDRKIENDEVVEIRNGLRFFTAPAHINPGWRVSG